jgi:hypothetical protein
MRLHGHARGVQLRVQLERGVVAAVFIVRGDEQEGGGRPSGSRRAACRQDRRASESLASRRGDRLGLWHSGLPCRVRRRPCSPDRRPRKTRASRRAGGRCPIPLPGCAPGAPRGRPVGPERDDRGRHLGVGERQCAKRRQRREGAEQTQRGERDPVSFHGWNLNTWRSARVCSRTRHRVTLRNDSARSPGRGGARPTHARMRQGRAMGRFPSVEPVLRLFL